jgi:hypothetical protein
LAGGAAVAGLAAPSVRAAPDEDLALLHLAASAELVLSPFLYRAITSRRFDRDERRALRAARAADQRHYSELVAAIGSDAPVPADFELRLPKRAFATRRATVDLGLTLERTVVGVYMTLTTSLQDTGLRALASRVGASQATHLSLFSTLAGRGQVAAPEAVDVERASEVLAPYWG